jgi:phospholipid/cholesterol/gamma-HCH transport system substrate-binding protein
MNRSRRFRLGLLALLAVTTFVIMLTFVLQGVLREERASYFILFDENVKGMVVGSKVNFQGVPMGMVRDIRFEGGRTKVELSVDPHRAEIQDITKARLDRLLVTGQVTVELEGYGVEGKPLAAGSFIEPKADPLHQLTKTLPEVVPQAIAVLDKLGILLDRGNALLDDRNRASVAAILQSSERAAAQLPGLLQRTDALLSRGEAAVAAMERTAHAVDEQLVPQGAATLAEAQRALADLRTLQHAVVTAADEVQAAFGGMRAPALATLTALRTSLDELRGFARQLRLAPDSLIFGVSRPAAPAGGDR